MRKRSYKNEKINFNRITKKIKEIDGITIGDSKISDRYFMKFIEEVGELSECIRKDKRMKDNNIKDTIEEELYDVLYYILCLANVYDIDIEFSNEPIHVQTYIAEIKGKIKCKNEIKEAIWIDRNYIEQGVEVGSILGKYVIPELVKKGLM